MVSCTRCDVSLEQGVQGGLGARGRDYEQTLSGHGPYGPGLQGMLRRRSLLPDCLALPFVLDPSQALTSSSRERACPGAMEGAHRLLLTDESNTMSLAEGWEYNASE